MRITFKSISIPTRAAKRLKTQLGLKEHLSRHWTAQVLGYANWHELNHAVGLGPEFSRLDEELDAGELRERRNYQSGRLIGCIRKEGLALDAATVLAAWRPSAARPQEDTDDIIRPAEWAAWGGEGRFLALLNGMKAYSPPHASAVEARLLRGIRNTRAAHLMSVCTGLAMVYCLSGDPAERVVGRRLLEALAARGHSLSMYTLCVMLKHSSNDADRLRAFNILRKLVASPGTPRNVKENAAKALAMTATDDTDGNIQEAPQGLPPLLRALRRVRVAVGLDHIAAPDLEETQSERPAVQGIARTAEPNQLPADKGALEAARHLSFLLALREAHDVELPALEGYCEEGISWLNTGIQRQRWESSQRWGTISSEVSEVIGLTNWPQSEKDSLIAELAVYQDRARMNAQLSAFVQERLAAENDGSAYQFSRHTHSVYGTLLAKYGRTKTILVGRVKDKGASHPFIVCTVDQAGNDQTEQFATESEATAFLNKL